MGKSRPDSISVNKQSKPNWGELNPEELYSTTMCADTRQLIQLTTDNIKETLSMYDKLMGNQPIFRRAFIMENRLSKYSQTEDDDLFDSDDDIE